ITKDTIWAVVLFLPLAPTTTLFARVLWIYLDQTIDPARRSCRVRQLRRFHPVARILTKLYLHLPGEVQPARVNAVLIPFITTVHNNSDVASRNRTAIRSGVRRRNLRMEKVEMPRCFAATIILLLTGLPALAQDSTPKVEVFGGYSFMRAGTGGLTGSTLDLQLRQNPGTFGLGSNFNGWNAEAQYNFDR